MARIPQRVAERSLDTGNVVHYPSGSPVGQSLQNAGDAGMQVVARADQRNDELDNFKLRIAQQQLDLELDGDLEKASQDMPADATGLHDGFVGQIDPSTNEAVKPGLMDEKVKKYREGLPASVQGKFDQMVPLIRQEYSNKAAKKEYDGRQNFYRVETTKMLGNLEKTVAQIDPNDTQSFESFRAQGEDAINSTGLGKLEKDILRTKWRGDSAEAVWKALVARDPQAAKAALGIAGGASKGIVDKIIGNESGGDANAKNPESSATGSAQFTSSTWMRVLKTYAPNLAEGLSRAQALALRTNAKVSRQMTEYLVKENTSVLNAAGVPVNDGTLYLAHFAGADGATKVLRAIQAGQGHHSVASILGPEAMAANKFLAGMTAQDLAAWATKKMGGTSAATAESGDSADERFKDIPIDRRFVLANYAEGQITQSYPLMKAGIQQTEQDALTSFQNTGDFKGKEPTRSDYDLAYGAEGEQRFQTYENAKATAKTVNGFTHQSDADINTTLASTEAAIPGGTGAADAQKNFEIMQKAAAQVKEARKQPADYVAQNFDSVAEAWKEYNPAKPETAQAAIALTTEMQKQIGIAPENIQPMPSAMVDRAASTFKDSKQPADARIQLLVGMVSQTSDPEQERAIFKQLVKAGVPEGTEVVIDAYQRGDVGAARRMFEAAMLKPEDVPGKGIRDAGFDDALTDAMFGDGTTGQAFYGLEYRDPSSSATAQRDFGLAKTAATLSMVTGMSQTDAIDQALKDIQGDVVRIDDEFSDGGGVLGVAPKDTDIDGLKAGMSASMPQVMAAVEALKGQSISSLPADVGPEARKLFEATHGYQSANLLTEGVFRPYGEGWGFYDPYSNAFLPGADGKALMWTTEQLMVAGKTAPKLGPVEQRDPDLFAVDKQPAPTGTGMFGAPQ